MVERLLDSTTLGRRAKSAFALTCLLALAACSARVVVEVVSRRQLLIPYLFLLAFYLPKFRQHELVDDATGRGEASWPSALASRK